MTDYENIKATNDMLRIVFLEDMDELTLSIVTVGKTTTCWISKGDEKIAEAATVRQAIDRAKVELERRKEG
jgi:hypothetical protein